MTSLIDDFFTKNLYLFIKSKLIESICGLFCVSYCTYELFDKFNFFVKKMSKKLKMPNM